MHDDSLAAAILTFAGLLLLTTSSAILLKRLRVPYTIGLVVIGMALGLLATQYNMLAPILQVRLTHDVILYVLLPVLIYDAAINIKLPALVKELIPVLMLAVVGVVMSMLIVAWLTHELTPLTLGGALLFGALISATDPVAVIALFKEVGAPERMSLLMDAESLFNDATAIVMFSIVMVVVQTGHAFDAPLMTRAVLEFFYVFLGGIVIGALLGFAMLVLFKLGRETVFVQIAHTTVLAYGSFLIADHMFGMSGIMAAIAAGVITRTYSKRVMADGVKLYLHPYWEFMSFVANSFIFLLLGFQENLLIKDLDRSESFVPYLVIAIGVVLLARFLVIYLLIPISNRLPKSPHIDRPTRAIMFWGGLRGVVPVALMLSIPLDFPERRLIIDLSLAVILFSLLVQGTTIEWLMGYLKVKAND
ncbi:cation:proton antiporter [Spongorhabdus nitratireducens]